MVTYVCYLNKLNEVLKNCDTNHTVQHNKTQTYLITGHPS